MGFTCSIEDDHCWRIIALFLTRRQMITALLLQGDMCSTIVTGKTKMQKKQHITFQFELPTVNFNFSRV